MDKIKLKNLLDNFNGTKDELYDKLTILNIKNNKFDSKNYNELVFKVMYLYHQLYGLENLSSRWQLPFIIDRNVSYDDFLIQLKKYQKYALNLEVEELSYIKNHFDNICRLTFSKLLDCYRWLGIYSSKVTKKDVQVNGKMYISVDNKDLHKFANILFDKCLENGLDDFEFKINNNCDVTRRDNVVIYFNLENFEQYITLINQIVLENPDIKFNEQQIIGYSINDNIIVGKDYENPKKSFTDKICETIIELRKKGISNDEIIVHVDEMIKNDLSDIIDFSDKLSEISSNKEL